MNADKNSIGLSAFIGALNLLLHELRERPLAIEVAISR
jgi:hypothetical protein